MINHPLSQRAVPLSRSVARRGAWLTLALACALGGLSGCAPLIVGGAMGGGVLVATDRRTTGMQVEDQRIELAAASRLREQIGERGRVLLTSYNRRVLLTGDVASEQEKALAEATVSRIENVQSIVNELGVMGSPSLTQRSSDTLITGRVKAAFVDAKDLSANAFKVTTERGTTYLMGRVTQREADRATDITRNVPGVQRVVRVFELISEDELRQLQTAPRTAPASDAQARPVKQ